LQVVDNNIYTLTVEYLKEFLHERFGVRLISFVCEDVLLYADFLPAFANNQRDRMSVYELLKMSNSMTRLLRPQQKHVEVKAYCEDSAEGFEVQLPKIRIPC
jgi:hypothetical protein